MVDAWPVCRSMDSAESLDASGGASIESQDGSVPREPERGESPPAPAEVLAIASSPLA